MKWKQVEHDLLSISKYVLYLIVSLSHFLRESVRHIHRHELVITTEEEELRNIFLFEFYFYFINFTLSG